MQKLPKRKYVNHIQVDWSYEDMIKGFDLPKSPPDLERFDQAYFFTEGNHIIQGFLYVHEGKPVVIPEPEPSILYYANSQRVLYEILNFRTDIFNSLGLENAAKIDLLFSDFFLSSFNFIINLFASIEAFNNSVIPEDFTYRHKKQLMNRDKIQRYARFDLKMENIVPEIFGKSFVADYPAQYEFLKTLKGIRDNLIHTKNFSKNWAASYHDIYRELLSFKYDDALKSTKEYMNYYKSNWIENH